MGYMLEQDGFIAVLEKVVMLWVLMVIADGMSGQQPPHHHDHWNRAIAKQQVSEIQGVSGLGVAVTVDGWPARAQARVAS